MAEARMIEMMCAAFWDASPDDFREGKTWAEAVALADDEDKKWADVVRSNMRAALSVLAANVSDEMVEAFKDKMEPYTDGSGFNYKAALAAAISAAAAGDEDRRA